MVDCLIVLLRLLRFVDYFAKLSRKWQRLFQTEERVRLHWSDQVLADLSVASLHVQPVTETEGKGQRDNEISGNKHINILHHTQWELENSLAYINMHHTNLLFWCSFYYQPSLVIRIKTSDRFRKMSVYSTLSHIEVNRNRSTASLSGNKETTDCSQFVPLRSIESFDILNRINKQLNYDSLINCSCCCCDA